MARTILTIGKAIVYQLTGEFVLRNDRVAETYGRTVSDQWQQLMSHAHQLLFGDLMDRERNLLHTLACRQLPDLENSFLEMLIRMGVRECLGIVESA